LTYDLAAIDKDKLTFNFPDAYVQQMFEKLAEQREQIERLFSSFFYITQTFLDYPFFKRISSEIDLFTTLKNVSQIDLRRIKRAFRIGTRSRNIVFQDFVKVIRDYASALLSFSSKEKLSVFSSELRSIEELIPPDQSIEALRTRLAEIKRACAFHEIALKEEWNKTFKEVMKEDINFGELRSKMRSVLKEIEKCEDAFHTISLLRDIRELKRELGYKVITNLGEVVLAIEVHNKRLINSLKNVVSNPDPNLSKVKEIYEELSKIVDSFK
ncbi:MAG: hypothetical protein ACTSQE_17405, partial [Candidatus Heimdallarchaeaceae archaeon]